MCNNSLWEAITITKGLKVQRLICMQIMESLTNIRDLSGNLKETGIPKQRWEDKIKMDLR
jgi:hypothetical protein